MVIQRAIGFLENRVDMLQDPYELALVSYALTLSHRPQGLIALTRLIATATSPSQGILIFKLFGFKKYTKYNYKKYQ